MNFIKLVKQNKKKRFLNQNGAIKIIKVTNNSAAQIKDWKRIKLNSNQNHKIKNHKMMSN